MKILLLTLTDDPFDPPGHGRFGGSHAFFFDLARQFVRIGHDVTIVTRLNSLHKATFEDLGPYCRIHRVAVGSPAEIDHHSFGDLAEELTTAVKELFQKIEIDIVQTSNWLSGAVACLAMPGLAKQHVHHVLSLGRTRLELGEESSLHDEVRDEWEKTIFSSANALVCVTEEEKNSLMRLYLNVKTHAVTIIPYGISQDVFFRRPTTADDFVCRARVRFQKGSSDIS
jgi:glycosyltransferase involved in cell wall biosynthesis